MHSNRLNHAMILHVHKDKLDDMSLKEIGNEFISQKDSRATTFGKFHLCL